MIRLIGVLLCAILFCGMRIVVYPTGTAKGIDYTQIGYDASSSASGGSDNAFTISHTIGAGSDRVLIVGFSSEDGTAADQVPSTVTYNSTAMTAVTSATTSEGTNRVDMYYMLETDLPSTGAYSLVVTFTDTCQNFHGMSYSFSNVAQEAPTGNANTATTSTTISTSITTTIANSYLIDHVVAGGITNFTETAGQTNKLETDENSSTSAGSTKSVAVAQSNSSGWTAAAEQARLAQAVTAIKPKAL